MGYQDLAEMFYATQFDMLPITCVAVAKETQPDPILARVYEFMFRGCSFEGDTPYYECQNEQTVHQSCILRGIRVIIRHKLQKKVLKEQHEGHLGIVKMKASSRSYV